MSAHANEAGRPLGLRLFKRLERAAARKDRGEVIYRPYIMNLPQV
jgi:hypothetical protein